MTFDKVQQNLSLIASTTFNGPEVKPAGKILGTTPLNFRFEIISVANVELFLGPIFSGRKYRDKLDCECGRECNRIEFDRNCIYFKPDTFKNFF